MVSSFVRWRRIVILVLIGRTLGAQPSASDSAVAASHFAAGRWEAAARAYAALVRRDSTNALHWNRYGVALEEVGRYDDAIPALRRALGAQPPLANQARYRLAKAFAGKGVRDSALAHLDAAAANGYRLWETARDDADFAALRGDPRFTPILARIENNRFPCRANAVNRQFDFWVGDWKVVNGTTLLGTNFVHHEIESCALQENWMSNGAGGGGKSWSFYDPGIGKWRQIFVFDTGIVWEYAGEWRDVAMRFEGQQRNPQNGQITLQRMTFFPVSKDSVRQFFQSSADGGKTWSPGFDGMYVRKPSPSR